MKVKGSEGSEAMPRKINLIDGQRALHELRPSVNQLSYMTEHSQRLLELLDVLIERTYALAPKRVQGYQLDRCERRHPVDSQRERLLEKAIWKQWNSDAVKQHGAPFQGTLCRHIQTFQMPLCGRRTDRSWGKIDIVGVTDSGLPVVLELKQEEAKDTPLRMLAEGLAYAVAVRRAWNEGFLRKEWIQCVTSKSKAFVAPTTVLQVPVIGIAPSDYWKRRIGRKGKRSSEKVPESAWKPFKLLCEACSNRGFPISFSQFEIGERDSTGLPTIGGATSVSGLSPGISA